MQKVSQPVGTSVNIPATLSQTKTANRAWGADMTVLLAGQQDGFHQIADTVKGPLQEEH
jgi:hypothetical protein